MDGVIRKGLQGDDDLTSEEGEGHVLYEKVTRIEAITSYALQAATHLPHLTWSLAPKVILGNYGSRFVV